MKDKPFILRNETLLTKFCKRFNQDMDCRRYFGCKTACALAIARETEYLMHTKNLPLGEAYRLAMRESLPPDVVEGIINDYLGKKKTDMSEPDRTTLARKLLEELLPLAYDRAMAKREEPKDD